MHLKEDVELLWVLPIDLLVIHLDKSLITKRKKEIYK